MAHWTQQLKQENKALREALDSALLAMRTIPQSRFDKYRNAGESDSAMAYRKAVEEVDRLCLATIQNIHDRLAEHGL
jgi:hypothetical protein